MAEMCHRAEFADVIIAEFCNESMDLTHIRRWVSPIVVTTCTDHKTTTYLTVTTFIGLRVDKADP